MSTFGGNFTVELNDDSNTSFTVMMVKLLGKIIGLFVYKCVIIINTVMCLMALI